MIVSFFKRLVPTSRRLPRGDAAQEKTASLKTRQFSYYFIATVRDGRDAREGRGCYQKGQAAKTLE